MAATNATIIQHYYTTTGAAAPSAGNLSLGEIGMNVADADMAIYAKNNSGTVKRIINNPAGLKYPTADGTANQLLQTDASGNLTFVTPAAAKIANTPAGTIAGTDVQTALNELDTEKQVVLVSGTNLKTINSTSLLGAGNINTSAAPINTVTVATTATTLTSTPTLLEITPASYGVTVKLPDATTCSVGGPLHIIDNRGAYPVRVVNNSGTLLGFTFGGQASYFALDDISTAAGIWAITNNNLVGASAQLSSASMSYIDAVVDIGSSQEVIIGRATAGTNCYGVVYNRTTNTFGAVTLIRTAAFGTSTALTSARITACLSAANQVLVISVPTAAATFEAVALSISGTTITVNTAATATLSANLSSFADDCGLIAVGSSFVTSYIVSTPAAQLRAMTISGTTVTIGSAAVLTQTAGGLILAASSTIVIATCYSATNVDTKPYTVSGSTLTPGTGTSTAIAASTTTISHFGAFSSGRYALLSRDGNSPSVIYGAVITLSGTTTTTSSVTLVSPSNQTALNDAIIVGSNKVLVNLNGGSGATYANILTDTAGTASAGTTLSLSGTYSPGFPYVSGTDVTALGATKMQVVSCSGASPTVTNQFDFGVTGTVYARTSLFKTALGFLSGTGVVHAIGGNPRFALYGADNVIVNPPLAALSTVYVRGISDASRWLSNTGIIQKLECAA